MNLHIPHNPPLILYSNDWKFTSVGLCVAPYAHTRIQDTIFLQETLASAKLQMVVYTIVVVSNGIESVQPSYTCKIYWHLKVFCLTLGIRVTAFAFLATYLQKCFVELYDCTFCIIPCAAYNFCRDQDIDSIILYHNNIWNGTSVFQTNL